MPPVTNRTIVAIALAGNLLAAGAAIFGYQSTGSSALLTLAILLLAVVAHAALLVSGLEQALQPADARHPLGHGKEIYFWSFVAGILLFAHGAGVAIFEGIAKLKTPPFLSLSATAYGVLAAALVLQAAIAYAWLARWPRAGRAMDALATTKDPLRSALAIGNIAGIAGTLVALAGLIASDVFAFRPGDAVASLGLGFIMAAVAAFFAVRTKTVLVGEAADPALRSLVGNLVRAEAQPGRPIAAVHDITTLHLGADDVLVAATVQFKDGESARTVEDTTARLERKIRAEAPEVSHVFLAVQSPGGGELSLADESEDEGDIGDHEPAVGEAAGSPSASHTGPAPAYADATDPTPPGPSGGRRHRKRKRPH